MGFLLSIFMFILGLFIGAFGCTPILTTLFFAIPFTKIIKRNCNVKKNIYIHFTLSIIIWIIIMTGISSLIFLFTNEFVSYIVGVIIALSYVRKQCGFTASNEQEYYESFGRYIEN